MIKTIIADDHRIFREGLKELLKSDENIQIIGEVANGKELLDMLTTEIPNIILLDINMPVMDGAEAAVQISKLYPDIKMLVLSMAGDETNYNKMIEAGAHGFLLKESSSRELLIAIEEIHHGGAYFSQELLRKIIMKKTEKVKKTNDAANLLSKRELDVLNNICQGMSNEEIGNKLFISPRTVEIHKAHLLEKTNSKNTINLILFAFRNKLVQIEG